MKLKNKWIDINLKVKQQQPKLFKIDIYYANNLIELCINLKTCLCAASKEEQLLNF